MPEKDIPTPYKFQIDDSDNTTYLFETVHKIGYAIKFKPTGYILRDIFGHIIATNTSLK
jgi:hypothetical protein